MTFGADWYPVALSSGLGPGRSAGTRLFDRELCIWRDTRGRAHAWEDRCPHRGMRLSFGFVRGDRIACLYHGWQYDAEGCCRLIPAHPDLDVPSTIRVATYRCAESVGMLWVYSDREVEAAPGLPIEPRPVIPVRSLYVDCAPAAVMQALATRSKDFGTGRVTFLSLDVGGEHVLAGLQPIGRAKTGLHIVLAGDAVAPQAERKHAVAAWAEALRRNLEAGRQKVLPAKPAPTHEAAL
jgi:nitrite reductase/ring-hydroxylating ferredoxin subunit